MALEIALDGGIGTVKAVAGLAARAGAKAALTSNHTAALADVTLTAAGNGTGGNEVRVTYLVPAGAGAALSVLRSGNDIRVFLATAAAGVANSTATAVAAAINAVASAVVVATAEGAGTGMCNALPTAYLTGGVDAAVLPTGGRFSVIGFDAANVRILPYLDADFDFFKATDILTVAIATLVTACTAP